MSSRPGTGRLGRRNTVHQTEGATMLLVVRMLLLAIPGAPSSDALATRLFGLKLPKPYASHQERTKRQSQVLWLLLVLEKLKAHLRQVHRSSCCHLSGLVFLSFSI